MAIVELADFQHYIRDAQITADASTLDVDLRAAEGMVRAHCHRDFTLAGDTPTARVFVPLSCELLNIDDAVQVTAVSNDGTATTGYQLEPLNGRDQAGNTVPYTALRLTSGAWVSDGQRATVSVSARWGWDAYPDDVVDAVKIMAKDLAWQRELKGDVAGFGDFGAVRMRQNAAATALLAPFVRWDRAGIA